MTTSEAPSLGALMDVRGYQVRVRVQGDGDPLLLLNGFTRPLESWEPFVEGLTGRTVVSFDAPGVGESPVPTFPLSIAQLADVAASVLDGVGLDRVDVLGFSHGGAVAQQFAVAHPMRVRRLVLVATSCGLGATLGGWEALNDVAIDNDATSWTGAVGALWQSVAVSSWSSIPFLGSIAAPTLVVGATHDTVAPPANSRLLAGRIADAALVMITGDHDLQRPEPARVLARTVEGFLGHQLA